ncbi:MAG: gamma-glutamyl-gamma-aminobutyrate hydrolase family protein [Bacteroidetes bacterium]|nr:gamma-glutamyl-gamma-aminobutyrate hydrolase family protein [Bacteroidota bacterium]
MKIGISKSESKFERYTKWLDHFEVNYEVLDYENHEKDLQKFDDCAGLILSGGVDIYPEIYCDWDTPETKGTYIPERDGFEMKLIEKAIRQKKPILGICRGLQLINVFFRGSLIFDLEEIRNVNHRKISETEDRIHEIRIFNDTLLKEIIKEDTAEVTSSHHQSADRLGEGLMISAKSPDGVIEAIEYADKLNKNFMIAVQYHPERFLNFEKAASKNLLERFLSECNK